MPEPAPLLPEVVREGSALRTAVAAAQRRGESVGFVPTMGALHEGHLSLVRAARRDCDRVVVSVFVNPTQFAPGEDYEAYPRDLEADRGLLRGAGCDLLFAPGVAEVYPDGCETSIDVGPSALPLEGAARPTHFRGVATVVLKLLNLCPADRAYFGRKDYQQTVVVRQMVRDLHVPTAIEVCPLVRDADGLALSSRNARLKPADRERALAVPRSLWAAERLGADTGMIDTKRLKHAMEEVLASAGLRADYIAFLSDGTLDEVETIRGPTVIALAVPVGGVRLLDNTVVG